MEFVRNVAPKNVKGENRVVPDNLLLAFYGIPERMLPPTERLLEKRPEEAWKYVLKCGGVTEGNPVPLQTGGLSQAQGKK